MADRYTRGWESVFPRHKGVRVGTLWTLRSDIEGDVTLSPYFDSENSIAQIDLLNDFIGLLTRERDLLIKEKYGEEK